MGMCCSTEKHEAQTEASQGHHSVYVHPEDTFSNHVCNVVYRPPALNERLAPGEAKPRFWINPNSSSHSQAMVSVAWCQPQHFNLPGWSGTRSGNSGKYSRADKCCSHQHHMDNPVGEGCKQEQEQDKGMVGNEDKCMTIRAYPDFLLQYINKPVRIRLVFLDPKVEQLVGEYGHLKHSNDAEAEPMMETSHLVRSMHSIKIHLKYSSIVSGLPDVMVEENHGGVKRLKRTRYRQMPVSWIDLDHRKPSIRVVGEQFELTLAPTNPALRPEDFLDGNGEIPVILGTYVRALDTCPNRRLHFSARLFHWFNQSLPAECNSDISTNCPTFPVTCYAIGSDTLLS